MSTKILVLGASGMLGSMVVDYLSRDPALVVTGCVRSDTLAIRCRTRLPDVAWQLFDAGPGLTPSALAALDGHEWIINAIGITKPLISGDAASIQRAICFNSLLPYSVADRVASVGARMIQIATDCVYSGQRAGSLETDEHDARDVYGKTKSLGEVRAAHVHHIRCSIIGPEPKDYKFLLEWLARQPHGATVNGFVNHIWNGVTTLHFAKVCHAIVTGKIEMPTLHHLIPGNSITKYGLLRGLALSYKRGDLTIRPMPAPVAVNLTLATCDPALNSQLWAMAGYATPPTIETMIREVAGFDFRLAALVNASAS